MSIGHTFKFEVEIGGSRHSWESIGHTEQEAREKCEAEMAKFHGGKECSIVRVMFDGAACAAEQKASLVSEVAAWRKRLAELPGEIKARKQEVADHPERFEQLANGRPGEDAPLYRLEMEQANGESYVGMYGHFADGR